MTIAMHEIYISVGPRGAGPGQQIKQVAYAVHPLELAELTLGPAPSRDLSPYDYFDWCLRKERANALANLLAKTVADYLLRSLNPEMTADK